MLGEDAPGQAVEDGVGLRPPAGGEEVDEQGPPRLHPQLVVGGPPGRLQRLGGHGKPFAQAVGAEPVGAPRQRVGRARVAQPAAEGDGLVGGGRPLGRAPGVGEGPAQGGEDPHPPVAGLVAQGSHRRLQLGDGRVGGRPGGAGGEEGVLVAQGGCRQGAGVAGAHCGGVGLLQGCRT